MKKTLSMMLLASSLLSTYAHGEVTMGFLGPQGTYSDQATQIYLKAHPMVVHALPQPSITEVVGSVSSGKLSQGLLPYYATISGFPLESWKNLKLNRDPGVRITDVMVMPVVSQLLVKQGVKQEQIKKIISHPNALKEAGIYLSSVFKDIPLIESASTAAAAKMVAESDGSTAAVAGPAAGKLYGLAVLADSVQDDKNNSTSFWIIKPAMQWVKPNKAKTLIITLDSAPVSALFNHLIQNLTADGFNVEVIHTSSIPGPLYTNRYVVVATSSTMHTFVLTDQFLVSQAKDNALLIGAY